MSTKAFGRLIYISGMGFIGESLGRVLAGFTGKSEGAKLLMRAAGAATGVYAGYVISSEAELIIEDAMNEVKGKHEEHLEVNHG